VARAAVGTAVVAGTAGAVHHHQDKKYAQQDYEEQQMYAEQEAYEPEPEYAPPPAQGAEPGMADQLQQLADLHASGVLSDEEFAAAKAKLLGG
jgi:hypothetical protein